MERQQVKEGNRVRLFVQWVLVTMYTSLGLRDLHDLVECC